MASCRDCHKPIPCHCHLSPPVQIRPGVYAARVPGKLVPPRYKCAGDTATVLTDRQALLKAADAARVAAHIGQLDPQIGRTLPLLLEDLAEGDGPINVRAVDTARAILAAYDTNHTAQP